MANFVMTTDKETAEKLMKLGFQQIPSPAGYKFINNVKMNFDEQNVDVKKCSFTNILTC